MTQHICYSYDQGFSSVSWPKEDRKHRHVSHLGTEHSQPLFSHKLRALRVKSWAKKKIFQGRGKTTQHRRKSILMTFFPQNGDPTVLLASLVCPLTLARAECQIGWWRTCGQHQFPRPPQVSTPSEPQRPCSSVLSMKSCNAHSSIMQQKNRYLSAGGKKLQGRGNKEEKLARALSHTVT